MHRRKKCGVNCLQIIPKSSEYKHRSLQQLLFCFDSLKKEGGGEGGGGKGGEGERATLLTEYNCIFNIIQSYSSFRNPDSFRLDFSGVK